MLHILVTLGLRQQWVNPHEVLFLENAILEFARGAASYRQLSQINDLVLAHWVHPFWNEHQTLLG